jgi:hypothetical protein
MANPMCAKPGCGKRVKAANRKFCGRRCGFDAKRRFVAGAVSAKPKADGSTSWWLDPATFYALARERFPL